MVDTYVSIDLETTGLNPKYEKIIEIGALKVVGGEITDTFSTFVNPARRLKENIVALTGIRDAQLADAPYMEEVMSGLMDFLGELPLLGHSIRFDFSFLKKAAVDQKLNFEKKGIDTLKIARRFLADLEHRSLDFLCDYYHIEHHAHRALEDARATHFLYRRLAEQFDTGENVGTGKASDAGGNADIGETAETLENISAEEMVDAKKNAGVDSLFSPAPLEFRIKRDVPATKVQKEQLYRLLEMHRIVLGADVERLTRSEASRLYDKIRANPEPYREGKLSVGE